MIRVNRFTFTLAQKFLGLTLPTLYVSPRFQQLGWLLAIAGLGLALAWLPLRLAIAAVIGTAFFIFALMQPILVLFVLIPVIPFSSQLTMSAGGANAGAMELLLLLAIALWGIAILTSRSIHGQEAIIKMGPLYLPFLLFLGGVGLSWLNALSIRASLIETIKWIEGFALYLFIINLLPKTVIKWAVLTIILTGTAQAVLGLYQFVFKVGPEGFLLFDGNFLRAYGTFAQPNPYAGYLGLVLPLVLSLFIWGFELAPRVGQPTKLPQSASLLKGIADNRLIRGVALSIPLLIMLAALFASQSRGAWLGFLGAAVVTIVVRSQKAAMLVAGLAVGVALVALVNSFDVGSSGPSDDTSVFGAVTQRFTNAADIFDVTDVATTPVTDANFATIERLAHWQAAQEMWRDNLWLGAGFGNYAVVYPAYAVGRWLDPLGHAHNYMLNLGAEAGLVGMTVYGIFWIWVFTVSFLTVRRSNGFYRAVAAGGLGILTHLHIHNMVDNLYVQGMYLHIAIILGIISTIYLNPYDVGKRSKDSLEYPVIRSKSPTFETHPV